MLQNYGKQQIKNIVFCYGNVDILRRERKRGRRENYHYVFPNANKEDSKRRRRKEGAEIIAFGFERTLKSSTEAV